MFLLPIGRYEEINDDDYDFDNTAEVIVKEEVMEQDFDSTFEEEIDPLMFLKSEVLQVWLKNFREKSIIRIWHENFLITGLKYI